MSNVVDSQKVADEKKGWKGLLIAFILSILFLAIFYLAVTNEPDYMPSQKQNHSNQTAFKNAPVMSQEALSNAEKQNQTISQAEMSDKDMKHMQHDTTSNEQHSH